VRPSRLERQILPCCGQSADLLLGPETYAACAAIVPGGLTDGFCRVSAGGKDDKASFSMTVERRAGSPLRGFHNGAAAATPHHPQIGQDSGPICRERRERGRKRLPEAGISPDIAARSPENAARSSGNVAFPGGNAARSPRIRIFPGNFLTDGRRIASKCAHSVAIWLRIASSCPLYAAIGGRMASGWRRFAAK